MSQKPVLLLVPGAWHAPTAFAPTTSILEEAGYTCVPISLPSVESTKSSSFPTPNFDADVDAITSELTKYADQGYDIIIVVHSYGGNPGSSACKGFLKSDRQAAGKEGGIVNVIYLSAFALPVGVSLMNGLNDTPLPWWQIAEDEKSLMPKTPKDIFYNDISDASTVDGLIKDLSAQSYGAMWAKVTYMPAADVECTYIYCEKDVAIPVAAQRGMVSGVKEIGSKGWKEYSINTDHSPFVGKPEEVAKIIREVAGESV